MGAFNSKESTEISDYQYQNIKLALFNDFPKTIKSLIPMNAKYPFKIKLPVSVSKEERYLLHKRTIKDYITVKSEGEEPNRQMTITVI
jgi:hypothetical protein